MRQEVEEAIGSLVKREGHERINNYNSRNDTRRGMFSDCATRYKEVFS